MPRQNLSPDFRHPYVREVGRIEYDAWKPPSLAVEASTRSRSSTRARVIVADTRPLADIAGRLLTSEATIGLGE